MSQKNRVTCRVPGSTSNCGSGFDTLGLALSVYNYLTIERETAGFSEDGNGVDIYSDSEMAQQTAALFFKEAGIEPFAIKTRIRGEVPRARGLGSSVTVRGGILAGLSALTGVDWSKDKLVELVTRLEGHPDNASASIMGGFTVSKFSDTPADWSDTMTFAIGNEVRFIVVSPEYEVLTSSSRGILPEAIDFGKVVGSLNGVSCLIAAIASGRFDALSGTVKDFVHEPYRLKGIPGGSAAIAAGVAAGAYTGWLSGSGSSVLCVSDRGHEEAVASAMKSAFKVAGLESVARDLSADNEGVKIESSD